MSLSRYTETTSTEHEADKRTIARILANDHRGKSNPISSTDLAEHTNCGASTVRDLIKVVRREYRLPIGSTTGGYFIATDADEQARQIERFRRQAETSRQSARDMAAAVNRARYGEL